MGMSMVHDFGRAHTGVLQNVPEWVWFVGDGMDAEELPKTASGKVMKHILRRWSAERV